MDNAVSDKKPQKAIFFFIFLILISLPSFFVWRGIFLPKANEPQQAELFVVEKGQNLFGISSRLEEQGFVKNDLFFNLYVILKRSQGQLQAGDYQISSDMSVPEIAAKIISGDVIKENITIPEGWNIRDISQLLEEKGILGRTDSYKIVGLPAADYSRISDLSFPVDFSQDYSFLKGKTDRVGLEGYLFPDTYEIYKLQPEEIIRKMLDNFDQKLSSALREEITSQGKTIFEVVTMASLLEKEVTSFEDKRLVAGVLWKRLANDFPLQVDSTITYVTGKKSIEVSTEETRIDSPFNTYANAGLPLGPICNPGLESVKAAVNPQESDYWYYLSTLKGETIFSITLAEHNTAKQQYLK